MGKLEDEVNALIAQLPAHQLASLKEIFGQDGLPAPTHSRNIAPKDKNFECEVVIVCRLCGFRSSQIFKSSSPMSSTMQVPTCVYCINELGLLTHEQLVFIAIKTAKGEYSLVEEAKNAIIQCRSIERREDGESDESGTKEST